MKSLAAFDIFMSFLCTGSCSCLVIRRKENLSVDLILKPMSEKQQRYQSSRCWDSGDATRLRCCDKDVIKEAGILQLRGAL